MKSPVEVDDLVDQMQVEHNKKPLDEDQLHANAVEGILADTTKYMARKNNRAEILRKIFRALDRDQIGRIHAGELDRLIQAMRSEAGDDEPALMVSLADKNSLSFEQMVNELKPMDYVFLEDLLWFVESVVRVEAEMRDQWADAVKRFRHAVVSLDDEGLMMFAYQYLPEELVKWLNVRIRGGKGVAKYVSGQDGKVFSYGLTQLQCEQYFHEFSHGEVHELFQSIRPLSDLLDLCHQAKDIHDNAAIEVKEKCDQLSTVLSNILNFNTEYRSFTGDEGQLWGCVLIQSNMLPFFVELLQSYSNVIAKHESKEMVNIIIKDVMNMHFEHSKDPLHAEIRQKVRHFLEFDHGLHATPVADPRPSISKWVAFILGVNDDYERGKGLDMLITWDAKRVLADRDIDPTTDEPYPPEPSVFSYGDTVSVLLSRLEMQSHHSKHESRTPIRVHILKFLMNIFNGSGERGRLLFRESNGIKPLMQVLQGKVGVCRPKILNTMDENEELDGLGVDIMHPDFCFHYEEDYADDQFYGPKDRNKVIEVLVNLMNTSMWGERAVAEEILQHGNSLDILIRYGDVPLELFNSILGCPLLKPYVTRMSSLKGKKSAEYMLKNLATYKEDERTWNFPFWPAKPDARSMEECMGLNAVLETFSTCKSWLDTWESNDVTVSLRYLADALPIDVAHLPELCRAISATITAMKLLKAKGSKAPPAGSIAKGNVGIGAEEDQSDGASEISAGAGSNAMGAAQATADSNKVEYTRKCLFRGLQILQLVQVQMKLSNHVCSLMREIEVMLDMVQPVQSHSFSEPLKLAQKMEALAVGNNDIKMDEFGITHSMSLRYPKNSPKQVLKSLASILRAATNDEANQRRLLHYAFFNLCYTEHFELSQEGGSISLLRRLGIGFNEIEETAENLKTSNQSLYEVPETKEGVRLCLYLPPSTLVLPPLCFIGINNEWQLWANAREVNNDPLTWPGNVLRHFNQSHELAMERWTSLSQYANDSQAEQLNNNAPF